MANKNQAPVEDQNSQSPEERFKELVLIREKEKQIHQQRQDANAQAEKRLEAAQREIQAKREQIEIQTQQEIDGLRESAIKEAEQEATGLISRAESEAQSTSGRADKKLDELISSFKEELLGK